ncbi:MAG: VOC family protein [Deltaproteobacteria bacterium]|nr:VOC family protein [Deltaproteobacteria bacterium]MBK8236958.1 VOC family protein [Deltaproteobacteria bacterium]MBK8719166.1 VOC family protein [Deltaproteobacteria bacterium]MBP7289792.1 VOC family protein [Nannocystaceae bacterium]
MNDIVHRPGQFVWREILTPNPDDSVRFYGEVLGWKTERAPMADGKTYTMFKLGEQPVGGCFELPAPGVPPHWALYVSTTDVEASVAKATAAGGKVIMGATDIEGFGRFATFSDPQGAVINVWSSPRGDGERAADAQPQTGEFCWEQLNSSDPKAAHAFYGQLFGWTESSSGAGMEVWSAGNVQVASRMQTPPGVPSHWLTYVVVDALSAANARVEKQGGKVLMPKIDIPTVGSISVIQDNVGAMLGLFEIPAR